MPPKNTIQTIITKFAILLANFLLVAASAQFWGSEGRGMIALLLLNVSIISIFGNIFCGSTIVYHASKIKRDSLLLISFSGALGVSTAGSLIFSFLFGFHSFTTLLIISFLSSLTTSLSSWWLGRNNIRMYNLQTLMSPLLILAALITLYFGFKRSTINTYFIAYYIGLILVSLTGIYKLYLDERISRPDIEMTEIKSVLNYGVKNETSYLIQFLNYRLSYYFIALFLGVSSLGLFSIVVAISEAVWVISRSMSAVHFSNVVNSDDVLRNRSETISFSIQSLVISVCLILAGVLIPDRIYQLVFGEEFTGLRKYLLYLMPGIISIAVSNLYGHYFAGTGRLRILTNKSLLGLIASLILLPVLVKKYQLTGACVSLDISYIVSSVYLWIVFRKDRKTDNVNA